VPFGVDDTDQAGGIAHVNGGGQLEKVWVRHKALATKRVNQRAIVLIKQKHAGGPSVDDGDEVLLFEPTHGTLNPHQLLGRPGGQRSGACWHTEIARGRHQSTHTRPQNADKLAGVSEHENLIADALHHNDVPARRSARNRPDQLLWSPRQRDAGHMAVWLGSPFAAAVVAQLKHVHAGRLQFPSYAAPFVAHE
jgi:hypothetical protein